MTVELSELICNYELRKISSIRHFLTFDAAKTLACSLILTKIDYCNALLSNISQANIKKLQKIQNSAAKLFRSKKYDHVQPLSIELHWLPVEARIKFKIALLCFKFFTEVNFPKYLTSLLQTYIPNRNLRSSNDSRLLVNPSITKSSYGDQAFSVSAPKLWNSLPYHVRHSPTLRIFKSKLKTFLFQLSYNISN